MIPGPELDEQNARLAAIKATLASEQEKRWESQHRVRTRSDTIYRDDDGS